MWQHVYKYNHLKLAGTVLSIFLGGRHCMKTLELLRKRSVKIEEEKRKFFFPIPRGGRQISSSAFLSRCPFGYYLPIASHGTIFVAKWSTNGGLEAVTCSRTILLPWVSRICSIPVTNSGIFHRGKTSGEYEWTISQDTWITNDWQKSKEPFPFILFVTNTWNNWTFA